MTDTISSFIANRHTFWVSNVLKPCIKSVQYVNRVHR